MATIAGRDGYWLRAAPLKFDPRARPAWLITIASLAITYWAYNWSELGLHAPELWWVLGLGAMAIIFAAWLRNRESIIAATMIDALALIAIAGLVSNLLQYPLVRIGGPLADEGLLTADRVLGFDWATFSRPFAARPVDFVLQVVYLFFLYQAALVLMYVCVVDQTRAWQFVAAALGSSLVAVIFLLVFAADGSFVGCGLRGEGLPYHQNLCAYGHTINGIKSGAIQTVDSSMYAGLVSMPSFHVAGGLILIWAVWHSRICRWLVVALNVVMSVAAITVGGHYLVDIIAGGLLGWAAIYSARKLIPNPSQCTT